MKIVEVTHALSSGGGERLVVDLCNNLAENKNNNVVLVITKDISINGNDHYLPEVSPKVEIIFLNHKYGFSYKILTGLVKVIKDVKPDVVHSHGDGISFILPHILFPRIKFFVTLHTLPSRWAYTKLRKRISSILFRTFVTPITISKQCQLDFRNFYGFASDVLVCNGRSHLLTTKEAITVRRIIEDFKKNEKAPVFIHVARAHPVKNHQRLFNTFKRLESEGYDFELMVLGSGYSIYPKELLSSDHFHIIGECSNVGDYMVCADYFVLSSDKEGLPISLLEAMSVGVIPVCTPAGGISDVIRNGINGYISDTVDDESFYTSVKRAIIDCGSIKREEIVKEYNEKYSMEICANNYLRLFNQKIK